MARKIKCRNENCLLNKELKCNSPCQHNKDFTCANRDVAKKKQRELKFNEILYAKEGK